MKFVWSGPAGAETIYPAGAPFKDGRTQAEPLFEGWLAPGKTIVDLPEDHPQAVAWRARGWLTPEPEEPAQVAVEAAQAETVDTRRRKREER